MGPEAGGGGKKGESVREKVKQTGGREGREKGRRKEGGREGGGRERGGEERRGEGGRDLYKKEPVKLKK